MIVIYAEKPDVGKKIAAALDCITLSSGKKVSFEELKNYEKDIKSQQFKDGYLKIRFEEEETFVTWGYGHLCELKSAKDYNESYKQWRNIPIPFIPQPYEIKIKDETKKQFYVVKNLIEKSSLIINATDYDKEGEVIFFYLMKAIRANKPFKRAHFSSQTKHGIIDAFKHLKDSDEVKNMTDAGRSRSVADWVVGCNLTVAMSLKYSSNQVLSIGRVQTPTLNMLVERELAIRNFEPQPYDVIKAVFETDKGEKYEAESLRKRIFDKSEAVCAYVSLLGKKGVVKNVESKDAYKEAPSLYNLSSLQMAANSKYSFTLAETLETAQWLYENGYTTYPRTDSQFLTEDMEPVVNDVLDALSKKEEYQSLIDGKTRNIDRKKYFDNSKVTSHYAIIPTTNVPSTLSYKQQKIYDLIVRSVIMMIYPKATIKKTSVITEVGEELFGSNGSVVVDPGWMVVDAKIDEKLLPPLVLGNTVSGTYTREEKETEPPKRYTDRTLVAGMIAAGKDLDDAELRKVMAKCGNKGIGTEATRASIIETLILRDYASREGKNIIPTEKGIALISALPLKEIKSAELTALWEERLENIAEGQENMDVFLADIEKATERWCVDIQSASNENVFATASSMELKCPGCGGSITKQKWGYGCSNYKNGCKFAVSNTIASKKLTDKQIESLIVNGNTGTKPLSGFVSKAGRKFEATVTLNVVVNDGLVSECKINFVFPEKAPAPSRSPISSTVLCPSCGNPITNGKWGWECFGKCGFSFPYTLAEREMSEVEMKALIRDGRLDNLNGFISKEGKYFAANLKLKPDKKGVTFDFSTKRSSKKKK